MLKALARDPLVRLVTAVWVLTSAIYFMPDLPAAALKAFSESWLDLPFLPLALFACFSGLRRLDTEAEQRFWRFWGLSVVMQIAVSLPYAAFPRERATFGFNLFADCAYLTSFLFQMLALETRPHARHTGSLGERQRRLMSAGLAVFSAFLLAYFVLVPAEFDRPAYQSTVPSFYLYIGLDALVLARLFWMRRETGAVRWRTLYAGLGVATGLALVADLAELYLRRDGGAVPAATALDLLWTTPLALFVVAVRARRVAFAADERALNETEPAPPAIRVGHVLIGMAMALPVVDYVMGAAGMLDRRTEPVRDIVALMSLVALGGFTLIAYRILDLARAQMERTERRLLHELGVSQKMDAVSRLAASVAHDFNNLLLVIQGRTDIITKDVDPASPLQDDLREIRVAVARASDLASELLAFGRRQPTQPVLVDLHDLVTRSAEMMRPLLDAAATIDLRLGASAALVRVDLLQFERALLNLAANARDAMAERAGATLTISTLNPPIGEKAGHPTLDRSRVLLRVSDNGEGIAPDTIDRIFEPFFTTKGTRGSGLGLAIVHGIVRQSGGAISVESTRGHGTSFTISLPVASGDDEAVRSVEAQDAVPGMKGAVLIVEEQTANHQLFRRLLADLDRPILQAASVTTAVNAARDYGGKIALVVADANRDDARMMSASLRQLHPEIKAVWLARDHAMDVTADDVVLQEPFEIAEVLSAAKRLLDGDSVRRINS
jgi:signal transduction histidine kinase